MMDEKLMKKYFLRIFLYAFLFLGNLVFAESKLDEIVITPSKRPTTIFNSLTSVQVITKEDIRNSGFQDVHEIFDSISSISIGSNGGHGQTKSIFMRGTESNHTKVLIDGIELNPSTLGVPSIQHISTDMIERVEISNGSMSTLYGKNTIGGVINIITRNRGEESNKIKFSSGRDETNRINIFRYFSKNNHTFFIDYSKTQSDGFKAKPTSNKNHLYKNDNINANYSYNNKDDVFKISFYQSDGKTEYDSYGSNLSQDHKDRNTKLSWTRNNKDSLSKLAFIDKQNKIDQADLSATDYTHTKVNQFVFEKNYYDLLNTNTILGGSYTDEAVYELSYGTSFRETNNIRELFFQSEYLINAVTNMNFGSRFINHDSYGDYFTGNMNFSYLIDKKTIFSGGIGKSFRPPDGTDKFGYGGNENLNPEKSISSELSLKRRVTKNGDFVMTFFNNSITNLIESDGAKMQNINKARITGIEFNYNTSFDKYDYSFNYTYQLADDLTNNTMLSRRPKNKFTGKILYQINPNDNAGIMFIGEGERDNSIYDNHKLGSYLLFNAIYNRKIDQYDLSLKVNNLFDKKHRKAHNYNSEGRSFYLGVTTSF